MKEKEKEKGKDKENRRRENLPRRTEEKVARLSVASLDRERE